MKLRDATSKKITLKDKFIQEHQSLVEALATTIAANRGLPVGIDLDDLKSWGLEGLIDAKKNFDEEKGAAFKTYAYYRIKGHVLDRLRKEWKYRNPNKYSQQKEDIKKKIEDLAYDSLEEAENSNEPIKESIDKIVQNSATAYLISAEKLELESEREGTKNPEVELIDETDPILWEEIKKLDEEEQKIIELFYIEGYRQNEISEMLNYSKSTLCRIHVKILNKLRVRLTKRYKHE